MLQQAVRKLRHGEHEDEIKEQLDEGDAAVRVPVSHPQVTGARRKQSHYVIPSAF